MAALNLFVVDDNGWSILFASVDNAATSRSQ